MSNQLTVKETQTLFGTKIKISSTGLKFAKDINYDEWEHIGTILQHIRGSVKWWIGDWIRYGEHKWGEKYSQAVEETNSSYQTLANIVWVTESIDISHRRENLSFGHHAEVASLDPKEQDKLLRIAEKEKLSVQELRQEVKKSKGISLKTRNLVEVKDKNICEELIFIENCSKN